MSTAVASGGGTSLLLSTGDNPATAEPSCPPDTPETSVRGLLANALRLNSNRAMSEGCWREAVRWSKRAVSVEMCRKWNPNGLVFVWTCEDCSEQNLAGPPRCGFKLCPACRRSATEQNRRVVRTAISAMADPRVLHLTVPNFADGKLQEMFDAFRAAWGRFTRRKVFREHVIGGVYVLEITNIGNGWHVHVHAVIDGGYWDQKSLAATWDTCWHSVAGGHVNTAAQHIQAPNYGRSEKGRRVMAGYLSKYLGKGIEISPDELERVAELARVVWGRRLVATFGSCHGVPVTEESLAEKLCPRCGGRMDCSAVLVPETGHLLRNRALWSGDDP